MQVAWDPDLNARHPRKITVALSARGYDLSFAHNEMGTLGESEHSDGLTSVAELRAGTPRRPSTARRLPRPTAQPEEARCGRRDAVQLTLSVPGNGPRVSSSAKLGGGDFATILM